MLGHIPSWLAFKMNERTIRCGCRRICALVGGWQGGGWRSGQSLIESCLVIAVLCLVLFGGVQISQLYLTREVLDSAATAGARARAVGLNDFMVRKVVRIVSLPIAGQLVEPAPNNNGNNTNAFWKSHPYGWLWTWAVELNAVPSVPEKRRMRSYLEAETEGHLSAILDTKLAYLVDPPVEVNLRHVTEVPASQVLVDEVKVTVNHDAPLNFMFHRAFYADEVDRFSAIGAIENHAAFYLQ